MDALQVVIEPRRREILRLVWDREVSAGDIAAAFDVTFGAVSQHLGVLRKAGFVRVRTEGNRRFYRADRERLGPLALALEAMWTATLDSLADTIEADLAAGRTKTRQPQGRRR
jgi:DNA-binding transcriptional ArsR family regulator